MNFTKSFYRVKVFGKTVPYFFAGGESNDEGLQ